MHILRSTFLPHYVRFVRPPYTTDPFPQSSNEGTARAHLTAATSRASSQTQTVVPTSASQSESEVLDRFILFQLHEDVFSDDSSLHTARPDTLRDLFDFMQPRARLADLMRAYGSKAELFTSSLSLPSPSTVSATETGVGMVAASRMMSDRPLPPSEPSRSTRTPKAEDTKAVYIPATSTSMSNPGPHSKKRQIAHTALRVSFSPRSVGLVYIPQGRTIVQVPYERGEPLERAASRLVRGLSGWLSRA